MDVLSIFMFRQKWDNVLKLLVICLALVLTLVVRYLPVTLFTDEIVIPAQLLKFYIYYIYAWILFKGTKYA